MIPPDAVTAGIRLVRAEEAWEPVLLGGLIPILGAGAVFALIRYAIKDPPEDKGPGSDESPPPGPDDSDHEWPLS